MYKLGDKSRAKLVGVHPDLVKVVEKAIEITSVDFIVTEGIRDVVRQRKLVDAGASRTMLSRHIPGSDGYGHAVDLAAWVDNQVDWSWPLYDKIAIAMKDAASYLKIPLEWGGDWATFKDGPHFQLPKKEYPE